MITDKGKEIIAKYLLGTAPAFASYIAVGCGPKPRPNISSITGASSSGTTVTCTSTEGLWVGAAVYDVTSGTGSIPNNTLVTQILSSTQFVLSAAPTIALSGATVAIEIDHEKEVLDFEMFRVPIISRGYVNDGGIDKLVLTADLPTEERYEISEIGIFSAGSNSSAGQYDSKTIIAFSETENWQYSNGTSLVSPTLINSTLTPGSANIITTSEDAIQTSANNDAFSNATRSARYEGARYLNNLLMVRGNTAHITGDSGSFDIDASKYIQLTGQSFNFSKNSSADLLKIAFSLVNVDGDSIVVPDNVRIMVEFTNNDGTQYAQLQAVLSDSLEFFDSNRYFVATKRFDELVYSTTFSWDAISIVKIYACVSDTISATNIEATAGTVTLTTASHGVPVNATITNVTALGGEVTYTSTNTFSPGDVVTITGVTSTPSNVFNLTNVTVIESTGSLFRVASTATGTYTSGGTAKMSAQKITFDHGTAPYTGTHIITSVPSSTSLEYYVDGASVTSTALSPNGTVDISRPEYFIALDAIRMDNVATVNPLYGLTGYTIIQNADATTITKNPNTNNYVEFRINLGVY